MKRRVTSPGRRRLVAAGVLVPLLLLVTAQQADATTPKPTPKHQKAAHATAPAKKPPVAKPLANLLLSTSALPSSGGTVTLTYSSARASSCSIAASPDLGMGGAVRCNGSSQAQVPQNAGGRTWSFTFVARSRTGTASATATVVQRALPTATLTISAGSVPATGGSVTLTFSSSGAASCSLSAAPQLWSGSNPVPVSCSGVYQATVPAATGARRWTFTFAAANDQGESATATQALAQEAPRPQYGFTSSNWSGYAHLASSPYTSASGRFQVPHVNCTGAPTGVGVSEWVGIGGAGEGTGSLLQTGIRSNCVSGVQQNVAWWELYPDLPEMDFSGLTVYPGDNVRASVYLATTGHWVTRVDDLTTGVSGWMIMGQAWGVGQDSATTFSVQGSSASLVYGGGASAEWIVEDYSHADGSYVAFADYGTVDFEDLTTSLPSWSLASTEGIALVDSQGRVVSTPGAVNASGGFTVSYTG